MKKRSPLNSGSMNQAEQPHLKIVHAVRERDHEAGVVVDGLVTENDINSVVQIPEIVLCRGQLAAVVLWVVPVWERQESEIKAPLTEQQTVRID